jgi:hypothetical protein
MHAKCCSHNYKTKMRSMIINYVMSLKSFIRNDSDNISHDHNIMSH